MYKIVETENEFLIYCDGVLLFTQSKSCNELKDIIEFIEIGGGRVNEIKHVFKNS